MTGGIVVVIGTGVVVLGAVVVVVIITQISPPHDQAISGQHTKYWPEPLQYTVPGAHSQSPSTPSKQQAPLPL